MLGPMVNIARVPMSGRTYEGYLFSSLFFRLCLSRYLSIFCFVFLIVPSVSERIRSWCRKWRLPPSLPSKAKAYSQQSNIGSTTTRSILSFHLLSSPFISFCLLLTCFSSFLFFSFLLSLYGEDRTKVSANVDERTEWEIYYPAFQVKTKQNNQKNI